MTSCCMSFGDENFGRMVAVAGGENLGTGLDPRNLRHGEPGAGVAGEA